MKPRPKRSMFNPLRWGLNLWIAVDQLGNVVTGGAPDETISGRMGRAIVNKAGGFGGWLSRTLCKGLNVLDRNHCVETYEYEKELGLHRPESLGDRPGD